MSRYASKDILRIDRSIHGNRQYQSSYKRADNGGNKRRLFNGLQHHDRHGNEQKRPNGQDHTDPFGTGPTMRASARDHGAMPSGAGDMGISGFSLVGTGFRQGKIGRRLSSLTPGPLKKHAAARFVEGR